MCHLDDDHDPCDVWVDRPTVARKPHECDCCGATIPVGAHYLRHFSVYEGTTANEVACFVCWAASADFLQHHGSTYSPSYLRQALTNCYVEGDDARGSVWREHLAGMKRRLRTSPAGRRNLQREWEKHARKRALVAEATRRWPGMRRVSVDVEGVAHIQFPGATVGMAKWSGGDKVEVYRPDLATWYDFDQHSKAGRPSA